MLEWILYLFLALAAGVFLFVRRQYNTWKRQNIPFVPPDSFIFGNIKGAGTEENFGLTLDHSYKRLKGRGPIGGLFFFVQPTAMALDPEVLRHILVKDFNYFHDRGVFVDEENDPLSGHLFALEGAKWKQLRAKLSPTFTSGKMKMMFGTMVLIAKEFERLLEEKVQKPTELEIKDILARLTTDIIGNVAFGIECNSLRQPESEFRKMADKVFDTPTVKIMQFFFMAAFPNLSKRLGLKVTDPDVEKFFTTIVKDTVEYRESNNIRRKDFMDMLIQIKNHGKIEDDIGEKLSSLSLNEIAAQSFVFFVAGFETSSTTMTWCLYELALNQDIQDRLRKDINEALKRHNGEITYDLVYDIPYLDQVVNEALRMHPPVVNLFRKTAKDYPIPGTKGVIPQDTNVIIPVYSLHRDPEYYPEPEKFDPQRFNEANTQKRHPYVYLPFGEGPRNCIGLRFGLLQTKIGLISLLRSFKVSPSPKTMIPIQYAIKSPILSPAGGMWLNFERL